LTILAWIVRLALGLVGLATLGLCGLALAAPFHWILALFGAWDRLILVFGLVGLTAFWLGKWRVLAVLQGVAVLALLFFNVRVPTLYPPLSPQQGDATREMVLAWANIHDNRLALKSLSLIPEVKKAKVIGLGEVPAYSNLQALFPSAQHLELASPSKETWGVETLGCRVVRPNGELAVWAGRNFGLKARCDGFTLFVLHLQNPTRGRGQGLTVRNLELQVLAAAVAKEPGPVLVMGDFNTTPSALPFYQLLKTANLKRVACGGPVAGTWRPIDWSGTAFDKIPGLKVTIDHILVRDIEVRACEVGSDVGSDHFPLIVTITEPN
jgi:endonuclease/exonuclease/phosphatase (EEP) superfamily protein YafD